MHLRAGPYNQVLSIFASFPGFCSPANGPRLWSGNICKPALGPVQTPSHRRLTPGYDSQPARLDRATHVATTASAVRRGRSPAAAEDSTDSATRLRDPRKAHFLGVVADRIHNLKRQRQRAAAVFKGDDRSRALPNGVKKRLELGMQRFF